MSSTSPYKWEDSNNGKFLLDHHLNYDVRYKVLEQIITHKQYLFHNLQICPSAVTESLIQFCAMCRLKHLALPRIC